MSILRFFGSTSADTVNIFAGELNFSSYVSHDETTYTYLSTGGRHVTLTGIDFVVNGANRLTSGFVTDLSARATTSATSAVEIVFSGLSLFATVLNTTSSDIFWYELLRTTDYIQSVNGQSVFGGLEGYRHTAGTLSPIDKDVRGLFSDSSQVSGDFFLNESAATLVAGDTNFVGAAYLFSGDVYGAYFTSTLVGGDDRIRYTDFSQAEIGQFASNIFVLGDAYSLFSSSRVFGGDDYIDLRDVRSFGGTVFAMGDAYAVTTTTASLYGGDDTIAGSRNLDNYISGDVFNMSGSNIIGGDDTIYGFNGNDRLYGDVGSTANPGIGGDDKIYGGGGNDTIAGNGGDDLLFKTGGTATVYGGDGNDVFRPDADGAHSFYGGSGLDTISYSQATTRIRLDLEDDSVREGWSADDTIGGVENIVGSNQTDFLYGTFGRNTISSGGRSDLVEGRGGGDLIRSGSGNDRINAGFGVNTYYGGDGFDLLAYTESPDGIYVDLQERIAARSWAGGDTIAGIEHIFGSDTGGDLIGGDSLGNELRGYGGEDRIYGRSGIDAIFGMADDDRLFGGSGFDRVNGGGGRDYIEGGRDNDWLWGGGDLDVFHFNRGDRIDTIKDFQNNVDTIQIDGYSSNFDPFANASNRGGDAYLRLGNGDWIVVENITVGALRNDVELV